MSEILNWLYVAGAVILLFGAAIFVHEFGHYWMALRRKMKVEAFAIGFGPKIFGWKKNGIDYSWRWIPAGGFVRIPQMITSEALEGKDKEEAEPIPPADPLSKILVAFAGPFMNIVFAFAVASVLYFTGLPTLINPSIVGYVDPESAEGQLGIREGDRIVAVDGQPTKSWHEVRMATILARTNVIPVVIARDGERKTYHLETEMNDMIGGKFLRLDSRDNPEILGVLEDGSAAAAGLKEGDVVKQLAGVKISGITQLQTMIQERSGEPTEMVVERNGKQVALTVTPKGDPGEGMIGVQLGSGSVNVYEVQKPGPTPWANIWDVVVKTFQTLGAVSRPDETGVGPKDLSGPIGIFTMLASQVQADYRLALNFLVLLNVNLAILNLLPLPVLDGGHIVMSIIEAIRRKPLSPKIQEYATTLFAVLLISFMLYVSFWDINRFRTGLFQSLFKQETQIEQEGAPATEEAQPAPAPAP